MPAKSEPFFTRSVERLRSAFPMVLSTIALVAGSSFASADDSAPIVSDLQNPQSVAASSDGRIFISLAGEPGKDGDGSIAVVQDGKAVPFVKGLDDPKGLVAFAEWLFVADKTQIRRIDRSGKVETFADASKFPRPIKKLGDLEVDEVGTLYVIDEGEPKTGGAIFRITPPLPGAGTPKSPNSKQFVPQRGASSVTLVAAADRWPQLKSPGAFIMDSIGQLLMVDGQSGELYSVKLADGWMTKLAGGFGAGVGMTRDRYGRLYVADAKDGRLLVVSRPGKKPAVARDAFGAIGDLCVDPKGQSVLAIDKKAGTLTATPFGDPSEPVDVTPLPLTSQLAFPKLKWADWEPVDESGATAPLRPIVLTHAGDGSGRVFVGTQRGVIHVLPRSTDVTETKVFLDIQDRVVYSDKTNEEGFLGFAFHPKYKENGEFFIYYTTETVPQVSIVSRFRVSKDDPNKADPASEEQLLRIPQPFWNHNGGTICFGPDGYLYIGLGDGGNANDPFGHAQNLETMLGSILRIDVDRKEKDRPYGIPKDNPFVKQPEACPEIFAYGFRNIWRMSFDRQTGDFWVADVGQNLWEEINLGVKGGNYGWNLRESLHPFGLTGAGPRPDLIDPIWEYHHNTGKSITGGFVYRGKRLPELQGAYVYADYVSGIIWALRYDPKQKRVVANQTIGDNKLPILSFGEDEDGELYWMTFALSGEAIYRFEKTGSASK